MHGSLKIVALLGILGGLIILLARHGGAVAGLGGDDQLSLVYKIGLLILVGSAVLRMFRDREMDFAQRFRAARARGDASAAMRMAHDLKSVTGSLAVCSVHEAAAKLERACLDGDDDARLETLLREVDRPLVPVLVQLQTL